MISGQNAKSVGAYVRHFAMSAAFLASIIVGGTASAQFPFNNNRQGVVGGISIDAQGVVQQASLQQRQGMLKQLHESVLAANQGEQTQLRVVSLKGLQDEIAASIKEERLLSDEARYLAGIQRVEYVFVDKENNDILIAGPAEGWRVRDDASVVGVQSGRPVLQLQDLLVAMATVEDARKAPISVSIDPTAEGQRKLNQLLSQVRGGPGFSPARLEPAMRAAFGPQQVTLTTVATDSRMAQTLVAADYQMKRLAMALQDSPVAGLPSYMEMIRNAGQGKATQPRWWISCQYESINHSEDKLAWQINGLGIKAMTESEFVDASGQRTASGKVNAKAQQWADLFTEKFDELCMHDAAFGDLRNVMDLNVVATLIQAHQLEDAAGCDLGLMCGKTTKIALPKWHSPKTLDPQCSFVRGAAGWTVSASGGVEINPWKIVATQAKLDESVATARGKAVSSRSQHWWWD